MSAGRTINIDGKGIRCPSAPLFLVKSNGHTVDIDVSHYNVECTFDRCTGNDIELWKLDERGTWRILRRKFYGKEKNRGEGHQGNSDGDL